MTPGILLNFFFKETKQQIYFIDLILWHEFNHIHMLLELKTQGPAFLEKNIVFTSYHNLEYRILTYDWGYRIFWRMDSDRQG